MKTYFMNNGDFDVRAMLTMGVSAKADDAIGYFGTGFKYAVAIILRTGGKIKVSTVSGVYEFIAKVEEIRGKEFQVVYCNGKEAGFTTRMGINWEGWMAFRELYCNAKDEGGEVSDKLSADWDTIIEVDCPVIAKCYRERADYFIEGKPLYVGRNVDIYKGGHQFIFYRGIAVKNAYQDQMFTYNIKSNIDLTEDRTVKYEHQIHWAISKEIQMLTDKSLLRQVCASGKHAESSIAFDSDWSVSDEFVEICSELMHSDKGICEGARLVMTKHADKNASWPEFTMSPVQQKMMDKAISRLAMIDVNANMYPIKTVTGLGQGVLGRAHDGTIYLSELPFNLGTKQVASTLLEEWVHLKTGAQDFDRAMQNWLFDKILSLSENIVGEPI